MEFNSRKYAIICDTAKPQPVCVLHYISCLMYNILQYFYGLSPSTCLAIALAAKAPPIPQTCCLVQIGGLTLNF